MNRSPLGLFLVVAIAALFLRPASASAGSIALMFDGGLRTMSNSPDTEKAIFDKKRGVGAGFGISYDRGTRWRFGVDVRRVNREGERAFAADRNSEAFRLGHPLTLALTEGLASATVRFGKMGPISPYVAVGGGVVSWKESSTIAGLVEKSNGTAGLFEGRVGVERQQGSIRLALEGGISFAPGAIGVGGISKVYEEKDLGGLFVVGRIGFSRR